MSADGERLLRLRQMAGMVLDARLQDLRREREAQEAIRQKIAALNAVPVEDGLALSAAAQAYLAYDSWASRRRADLNLQLAERTAACLQAEAEARQAFGRKAVTDRITPKT